MLLAVGVVEVMTGGMNLNHLRPAPHQLVQ